MLRIPLLFFSKEFCPYCKKAKEAFQSINVKFLAKELEDNDKNPLVANPGAFQDYLAAKTNAGTSVPKVFIRGAFIGGGDDVVAFHQSGELEQLCSAKKLCAESPVAQ